MSSCFSLIKGRILIHTCAVHTATITTPIHSNNTSRTTPARSTQLRPLADTVVRTWREDERVLPRPDYVHMLVDRDGGSRAVHKGPTVTEWAVHVVEADIPATTISDGGYSWCCGRRITSGRSCCFYGWASPSCSCHIMMWNDLRQWRNALATQRHALRMNLGRERLGASLQDNVYLLSFLYVFSEPVLARFGFQVQTGAKKDSDVF